MAVVYLLIIFVFLLKKYLDKQSESSAVQGHFLREEEIDDEEKYDKFCPDHFEVLKKSLIFCTYDADKFRFIPYEIASIRSLKDDLDDIFAEKWFECFFRNQFVEENIRPKLLVLKETASLIPYNEWLSESIDLDRNVYWREINIIAEEILTDLNIEQRTYNIDY
ncbi:hypothetical protein MKJ01_09240 [Chryseobacterium sp. SSA4.19]|uniref:hypothetical protein n=1 Tax=Chryseobacterium sp. SSA4.19 TaxID=2919915 RepID=UPI001F4D66A9|nr:hypothetical protein [Chryseobacterium sp. SSA4.19]MCJ8153939.1 hypothetical protein [Chryseobacterium sp. SSA4.19]